MKPGFNSNHELNRPIWQKIIKNFFNIFGFELIRINSFLKRRENLVVELDDDSESKELIERVNPYINSATIPTRWSLIQSMKYIHKNNIEGALLECGVFQGGSLGIICLLAEKYKLDREIYAYDTFGTGFSVVTEFDLKQHNKKPKKEISREYNKDFYPTIETVKNNLITLGVKQEFIPKFVQGKVEETLYVESNLPKKIALARIDTDFYDSTKHELEVFYPRLTKGGILHINDYGGMTGVKKAVDDYFADKNVWMHRVDYTTRLIIKD